MQRQRGMGRATKQADDVRRAESQLREYELQLQDLEDEIADEADRIREQFDPLREEFEIVQLKPRKSDIDVRMVALGWVPGELDHSGDIQPLM